MSAEFFAGPTLAIESSCDETSAAVVSGRLVLSNIVASQAKLHEKWGGVVPEAAARAHVEAIIPVVSEALSAASISLQDVKAVAVTNRPGLVGALSVGVTAGLAFAHGLGVPLLGVHHLEGHIVSPWAVGDPPLPHLCLLASGGHTELVLVRDLGSYELVGQTLDDAAGEAFDKAARLLGLGYPGGRAIQDAAIDGDPDRYPLPRGLSGKTSDFSFSGLKTAVRRLVEAEGAALVVRDAAASVQKAIASVLWQRAIETALDHGAKAVTLAGGVAANLMLRTELERQALRHGLEFIPAPIELCTDNAAMIGLAANFRLARGESSGFDLDVLPNAPLP